MSNFNPEQAMEDGKLIHRGQAYVVLTINAPGSWPIKGYHATTGGIRQWEPGNPQLRNISKIPKKRYTPIYCVNNNIYILRGKFTSYEDAENRTRESPDRVWVGIFEWEDPNEES